jgi:hypothetical protein
MGPAGRRRRRGRRRGPRRGHPARRTHPPGRHPRPEGDLPLPENRTDRPILVATAGYDASLEAFSVLHDQIIRAFGAQPSPTA